MTSKGPLIGGVVTGVLSLLILWMVGRLGAAEARLLLESSLPTVRFLCSSTSTAAATILALMLTLLSLSYSPDRKFHESYYQEIRGIARYSTICLTLSILVLLMLVVPLESAEGVPSEGYAVLYYLIVAAAAVLGGLIVAIMLMLYNSITSLIDLFHPGGESYIIKDEDETPEAREERERAADESNGEQS